MPCTTTSKDWKMFLESCPRCVPAEQSFPTGKALWRYVSKFLITTMSKHYLVYVSCNHAPRCFIRLTSCKKCRSCETGLTSFFYFGFRSPTTADRYPWHSDFQRNRNVSKCHRTLFYLAFTFIVMSYLYWKQIDWEESSCNDRVCIKPNIDDDLDHRKHVYHGIDSVLVSSISPPLAICAISSSPMLPSKYHELFLEVLPLPWTLSIFLNWASFS